MNSLSLIELDGFYHGYSGTSIALKVNDIESEGNEMILIFPWLCVHLLNCLGVGKLHTNPMKNKHAGDLHEDEYQDHLLDLDLGLLICHPGTTNRWKAR